MKIYLFHPETGIYLGEDFAEELSACRNEADLPHATTIAAPPFRRGEVPVFVVAENRWEIRPISPALVGADGDPQANRLPQRQAIRQAQEDR